MEIPLPIADDCTKMALSGSGQRQPMMEDLSYQQLFER
jgi:hypothetical protein